MAKLVVVSRSQPSGTHRARVGSHRNRNYQFVKNVRISPNSSVSFLNVVKLCTILMSDCKVKIVSPYCLGFFSVGVGLCCLESLSSNPIL